MLLRDPITLQNAFVRLEPLSLAHADELAEATVGLEHAWYTSVPSADGVVAEIEQRLESYAEPIEVAVLGCAVNGIGEASHADFGITGAKDEGLIFAHGKPLRKIPQEQLVDVLFEEIDKSLGRDGRIEVDAGEAAEGAEWLRRIEEENAGDLTPEKLAAMEKAAAESGEDITAPDEPYLKPVKGRKVELGEEASPTSGRRFTRA